MNRFNQICIFIIGLCISSASLAADISVKSLKDAWFKPHLIANKDDAMCKSLVEGYQNYFVTNETQSPLFNIQGLTKIPWVTLPSESGSQLRISKFKIDGKYYALVRENYSIGWREGYHHEILIDRPFNELGIESDQINQYFRDRQLHLIEDSGKYKITLKGDPGYNKHDKNMRVSPVNTYSKDRDVYMLFKLNRFLGSSTQGRGYGLLKFNNDADLELICEIKTYPSIQEQKKIKQEIPLMKEYLELLFLMMGGSGYCGGTLDFQGLAINSTRRSIDTALYRPWSLSKTLRYKENQIDAGFDNVTGNLEFWGYSGIWNYQKYKQFIDLIPKVEKNLIAHYSKNYDLNDEAAKKLSKKALSIILISAFDHGVVKDKHHNIHKKILSGVSIDELNALSIPEDIDTLKGYGSAGGDSLLAFAITQPDLMTVLVNKGLDLNKGNNFNKTALMYAAQFNDVESARILLNKGADPNISTTQPMDSCNYALETTGVTALHYAVRYASLEFIKLLLQNGASVVAKDSNGYTPIDYLLRYGGSGMPKSYGQTNHFLSDQDRKELETLLASPKRQ